MTEETKYLVLKLIAALIVAVPVVWLVLFFVWKRQADATPSAVSAVSAVSVQLKPEEAPVFERVYRVEIDGGFVVEVPMRTWGGKRTEWLLSKLTQRDGRYIFFNVNAVADKILDPILVPKVQARVDEILALDKAFVAPEQTSFVDAHGVTWRRDGAK